MSAKIAFFLQQYALLGVLLVSTMGWGRLLTARLLPENGIIPRASGGVLQATAGLGVVTIITFVVAACGALTTIPVLTIVFTGVVLYIPRLITSFGSHTPGIANLMPGNLNRATSVLLIAVAAAFTVHTLARPLKLPLGWDEIAYHLPTAQAWAASGGLVVTDWLRYPLLPFNMELLYAGTLILANDTTTHLVHALTGFLAVVLTFSIARMTMPLAFAALAAVLLVYAIRQSVETADIDLGLMLYIFCACACLGFCYPAKQRSLVLLSAFFIGLALGTKYQAVLFLPAYALGVLLVERNWKIVSLAVLIAISTGSYWYIRNFVVSGDPVHPLGGPVLGYWLWNADDIRRQLLDLHAARSLPPPYLWPGIGSLVFWKSSAPPAKGCMVIAVAGVLVWLAVSGYDRYLMPMYPLLAILSSYFFYRLIGSFNGYRIAAGNWARLGERAQLTITIIILLAFLYDWGKSTYKDIGKLVLPDSVQRIALLKQKYPGFELLGDLRDSLPGTVYQLGFEDEIYYLGTPVLGDHFGRARYLDVMQYAGKSAELSRHLRSLGASYLLVNLVRHPTFVESATGDPQFPAFFDVVANTPRAVLYRLKEASNSQDLPSGRLPD